MGNTYKVGIKLIKNNKKAIVGLYGWSGGESDRENATLTSSRYRERVS